MRLNKILVVCFTILLSISSVYGAEKTININFKDLKIVDLIKVTSKIINKNILMTQKINGKVDFISNKPVSQDDILNIPNGFKDKEHTLVVYTPAIPENHKELNYFIKEGFEINWP